MSKKKPIEIIKNYDVKPSLIYEKDGGLFANIKENMISQVVEARDEQYYKFLINEIQSLMISNDIQTCFVLNKEELTDCLQEHNKLHCKINNLEEQLDQQKAMWQKLKEWLIQTLKGKGNSPKYYKLNDVLEKMQELEGEGE